MIYISSGYFSKYSLNQFIKKIIELSLYNIELSAVNFSSEDFESYLLSLKKDHNLNLLLHNYYLIERSNIVLNTADQSKKKLLIDFFKRAIDLSIKIGAKKYAIHSGFLFKIDSFSDLNNHKKLKKIEKNEGLDTMLEINSKLRSFVGSNLKIYFENNIISKKNYELFNNSCPFILCNSSDLEFLLKNDINILTDIGHLKVSSKTLNFKFLDELNKFLTYSDYLHISDNDSFSDQGLSVNINLWNYIKSNYKLKEKTITFELNSFNEINKSLEIIKNE